MGLIELKMIILFADERLCGSDIDLDVNIHVSQTSLRSKSTPTEFLLSVTNTVVMCPQNTPKSEPALWVDQL